MFRLLRPAYFIVYLVIKHGQEVVSPLNHLLMYRTIYTYIHNVNVQALSLEAYISTYSDHDKDCTINPV